MTETTIWWIVGALFLGYALGRMRRAKASAAPTIAAEDLLADALAKVYDALTRGAKIEAIRSCAK